MRCVRVIGFFGVLLICAGTVFGQQNSQSVVSLEDDLLAVPAELLLE